MNKFHLTLVSMLAAAALMVGCGGGGDDAPLVASQDLTAPVSATSVGGISGESFTFAGGVVPFGTVTPTTVAITSTSTFSVTSAEGTASGNLSFGSCIFTVTNSTYPAVHPLGNGKTLTVQPCNITVDSSGLPSGQNAVARAVSFVLAGNASQAKNLSVIVTDSGQVVVKGVTVGTVTLTPATGATGGA